MPVTKIMNVQCELDATMNTFNIIDRIYHFNNEQMTNADNNASV